MVLGPHVLWEWDRGRRPAALRRLQSLDERGEPAHGLKVVGHEVLLGHDDAELLLDVADETHDAQRVHDAAAEQRIVTGQRVVVGVHQLSGDEVLELLLDLHEPSPAVSFQRSRRLLVPHSPRPAGRAGRAGRSYQSTSLATPDVT